MELLLNLAWILLALPAYWLWRRGAGSRQCLLALSCALVLLFPVISATDDLHAMRAEMEDSAVSKRAVRQAAGDKTSSWNSRLQSPPALASAEWQSVLEVGWLEVFVVRAAGRPGLNAVRCGRAPPVFLLG